MAKQITYKQERKAEEDTLSAIFGRFVPVVGQGFNINFAYPINKHITETQIRAALDIGYSISSIEAVVNQPGMNDHLHIWLHKIQERV